VAETPSPPPTTSAPAGPLRYLKYTPLLTVTLVGLYAQFQYLPNHDTSWLLHVSQRLAEGAALYSTDIVEINPPLIVQLTSIAVHAGRWLHLDPLTAWRLLVGAQIGLSLWLSDRWLRGILGAGGADLRSPLLALLAWIFACLPGYDYGQREHLIVLWLTPYLLAAAGRYTGAMVSTRLEIVTGLLPALVLCLKPHYVLSIVAVEATVAASRRSIRALLHPGAFSCVGTMLLYGLSVVLFYPGFLSEAVPLGVRYYPSFGELRLKAVHVSYWIAGLVALAATRSPRIAVVQARIFAAAAFGAFAAFLVQQKSWPYHFLPTKTFLLLTVAVALAAWGRTGVTRLFGRYGRGRRHQLAMLGAIALTVAATAKTWADVQEFAQSKPARDARDLTAYIGGITHGRRTSLAAISYSLAPAFPVTEMLDADWGMRFSCLWVLPGVVMEEERGQAPDGFGRPYLQGAVDDDFDRWHPEFVIVDERRQPSPLPELLKDARFERIWREYREVGRLHLYRVFQRDARPSTAAPGVRAPG
jgi:hypothetical protein